jgi:hypothetical protein
MQSQGPGSQAAKAVSCMMLASSHDTLAPHTGLLLFQFEPNDICARVTTSLQSVSQPSVRIAGAGP